MRRVLKPAQIAEIRCLRRDDPQLWSLRNLARRFQFSPQAIFYAINGRTMRSDRPVPSRAICEADAEAMLRAIPADTRDLTARLMGDPLPGRSALDKKREAA